MPKQAPHPEDPPGTAGRMEPPALLRSALSGMSMPQPLVLDRLADLVADGEVELPVGLSDEEQEQLVRLVRQRLRHRILDYVARQIALDLWREARFTE